MYVLLINDDHMQELHPTAQLIFSEDSTVRHKMKLGTQPPGLLIGQRPPRFVVLQGYSRIQRQVYIVVLP